MHVPVGGHRVLILPYRSILDPYFLYISMHLLQLMLLVSFSFEALASLISKIKKEKKPVNRSL